jgi:peroxiredoxin
MDNETPSQVPPTPPASSLIPAFVREHWILIAGFLVAGLIIVKGLMPETGSRTSQSAQPVTAARDFTLAGLDGKPVKLSSFRGNSVVILDFWATWCPPCRMSMPILQKLKDSLGSRGLVVLSIDQGENADTVRSFIRQNNYTLQVLLDPNGAAAAAWGVTGLPTMFVIDKEGVVRDQEVGYDPAMETRLTGLVNGLL